MLFHRLEPPIRVVVLETPAGFQPNSAWVAGRLARFVEERLQNFHPQVTVVPARRRDGPCSTDDPELVAPLLEANYIFVGPGSPTYTVRHLRGTRAWHLLVARQRRGAVLALASAAAIGCGAYALPVYEIYKAGADLHWIEGLDLFRPYGLELVVVTHWNNTEGGLIWIPAVPSWGWSGWPGWRRCCRRRLRFWGSTSIRRWCWISPVRRRR